MDGQVILVFHHLDTESPAWLFTYKDPGDYIGST